MWINPEIRIEGGLTLLNIFSLFFALYVWRNNSIKISYSKSIYFPLKNALFYYFVIPFVFALLADGPLLLNLLSLKSLVPLFLFIYAFCFFDLDSKSINKSNTFINLSFLLLCLYGIYNYITETNPLIMFFNDYMSIDSMEERLTFAMNDARAGLKGRITGTATYTIQYGILIGFFILAFIAFKTNNNKSLLFILFSLGFVNIFLTASRGPLLAIFISLVFYFVRSFSIRKQIICYFFLFISFIFFDSFWDNIINPFFNVEGGSSTEGRMGQLYGAWIEISHSFHSILFGFGPYWIPDYLNRFGWHPLCFSFESSHISGLVSSGILGLIFVFCGRLFVLWKLVYNFYKMKIISSDYYYMIISLLLYYLVYSLMVGGVYDNIMIFMYVLFLKFGLNNNKKVCIYAKG